MSKLAGKSVSTGSRNVNPATDMAPKDTSLPGYGKPLADTPVSKGPRDHTLSGGKSK